MKRRRRERRAAIERQARAREILAHDMVKRSFCGCSAPCRHTVVLSGFRGGKTRLRSQLYLWAMVVIRSAEL